ncbi:MAG: hypothetical protein KDB37_19270, partial [Ilumatobacter sp.]|nr:hypothetical protein [Ilumatobacter sp.]
MTYGFVKVRAASILPGDRVRGWPVEDGGPPAIVTATQVMLHPLHSGTAWIKSDGEWFYDRSGDGIVEVAPTFTLNRTTFAAWARDVGYHEFDGELIFDDRNGEVVDLHIPDLDEQSPERILTSYCDYADGERWVGRHVPIAAFNGVRPNIYTAVGDPGIELPAYIVTVPAGKAHVCSQSCREMRWWSGGTNSTWRLLNSIAREVQSLLPAL